MKKVYRVLLFLFMIAVNSCSDTVCGEFEGENKKMIDSVNLKYAHLLRVEPISCEYRYIGICILSDTINKTVLDSVHMILYRSPNSGWATLDVYDSRRKYKYSHGSNGNIYQRSGD